MSPPSSDLLNRGIIIGVSEIPIYQNILDLLEQFRFSQEDAVRYLKNNKHNHITTTYSLLLKRYERLGKPLILREEKPVTEETEEDDVAEPI